MKIRHLRRIALAATLSVTGCADMQHERQYAPTPSFYRPDDANSTVMTIINGSGVEIRVMKNEGRLEIQNRDFSSYGGLLLDCYVRPVAAWDVRSQKAVPNFTSIAVSGESNDTTYCQPLAVSTAYPPLELDGRLLNQELRKTMCLKIGIGPEVTHLTEDITTCRRNFAEFD